MPDVVVLTYSTESAMTGSPPHEEVMSIESAALMIGRACNNPKHKFQSSIAVADGVKITLTTKVETTSPKTKLAYERTYHVKGVTLQELRRAWTRRPRTEPYGKRRPKKEIPGVRDGSELT